MKLTAFLEKRKDLIPYLIFGVATTMVNYLCYIALYRTGLCNNVVSTALSWLAATIFAFVTNKLYVFKVPFTTVKAFLIELGSFYFFRIATGVLDVFIMWLGVDVLNLLPEIFKLISNVLVVILNYIASKLFIFRKR